MKLALKNLLQALKHLITGPAFDYSSSMAYSALLSLFPFLIFLTSLAEFLGSKHTAADMVNYAFEYLPQNVVETLAPLIEEVLSIKAGSLLTLGALGALWGASLWLETLRAALNLAYRVEEHRPFWKRRLQSACLVLLIGFASIILFTTVIGGGVIAYLSRTFFEAESHLILLWHILRYVIGALVIVLMASFLYRHLPDVHQSWREVIPGALLGSMLWLLLATIFTELISRMTDYSKTYGSLGGIIITLLFFQLSSLLAIFGAEFNAVRRRSTPPLTHQ